MPELPEVETIKRGLEKVIVGRKIVKFESRDPKVVCFGEKEIEGMTIIGIQRRAKILVMRLEGVLDDQPNDQIPMTNDQEEKILRCTQNDKKNTRNDRVNSSHVRSNNKVLLIHLKMTGQLIWEQCEGETEFCLKKSRSTKLMTGRVVGGHPSSDWVNTLPSKYTRAIFYFDDGSVLFFNDLRRFGYLKVYEMKSQISGIPDRDDNTNDQISMTKDQKEDVQGRSRNEFGMTIGEAGMTAGMTVGDDFLREIPELKKLGPEPLDKNFQFSIFNLKTKMKKTRRAIKLLLLDQEFISGIGNIYVDETLFLAGVMPDRLANSLNDNEMDKIFDAIPKVLLIGIKYGGSSEDTYVDAFGNRGTMGDHSKVYRRTGQLCPNGCGGVIERMKLGGRGTHFCRSCQK